jgi:hypothetical protein
MYTTSILPASMPKCVTISRFENSEIVTTRAAR